MNVSPQLKRAIALLALHSPHRFDSWDVAGPHMANVRQKIMGELLGRPVPKSQAGVTAIVREFLRQSGIEGQGTCAAVRLDLFRDYCKGVIQ